MRLKHCMRLMSLIFRTWMRLAATDKHQSGMHKQTNVQTNKQTSSQTKSRLNGTYRGWQQRDAAKRLVYQMPVQGRRTTLLDAITQAHSTAHMEQNATRIIPLPNALLAGTFFFIHLWTFTSSTVSQSVFWVFFFGLFFSEIGFDTFLFGYFGRYFGLVLFFVVFGFHLGTLSLPTVRLQVL